MHINFQSDRGGEAVDLAARNYQAQHPGVSYLDACKIILREAQHGRAAAEARYSREHPGAASLLPGAVKIYKGQNGSVVGMELEGSGQNINRLSNLVVGLPKLADGSIDAALAAQVVNSSFVSLGQGAAGDFLYAAALRIVRDKAIGPEHASANSPREALLAEAMKEAKTKYAAVSKVYAGSAMTEQALRDMLWPLFRVPAPQYSQSSDVRRYSADHISYDAQGREIRKY